MKQLQVALWVEVLKVRKTRIFPISLTFFAFIGVMMGLLMYLSIHPDIAQRSSTISMKTSFLGGSDWKAFYELLIQIILTLGVIGSGIITSWVFGREFSDRAIKDMLALPVRRSSIVISKLIVLIIWSLILALTILVTGLITGSLSGIGDWHAPEFFGFLTRYLLCALLNTLLITPVALVASAGRGYMLPISFVILILVLTQLLFVGLPAAAFWFPWALPALFSGVAGDAIPAPGFTAFLLYVLTVLTGLFGTIAWWRYADHK